MQKHFSGGAKEWLLLLAAAALLIGILFFPLRFAFASPYSAGEQQLINAANAGEVIRVHIIANSDSAADQSLKLKIRDALLNSFGEKLREASTQSREAVCAVLSQYKDSMAQTAQNCASQNGFSGSVRVETGCFSLAEKRFGNVLLPAGSYEALLVVIGEGRGQNWWGILYPQLSVALEDSTADFISRAACSCLRALRHWFLAGK